MLEHFVLPVLSLGLAVFVATHPLSEKILCICEPSVFIPQRSGEIQTRVSSACSEWYPVFVLDPALR